MAKKKRKNTGKSVQARPELVQSIIQELISGTNKRMIANRYGVDVGNVYSIYDQYKNYINDQHKTYINNEREKLKVKNLKKESVEDIGDVVLDHEEKVPEELSINEERTEEMVVAKEDSKRHRLRRIDNDTVEKIMEDLKEHVMSQADIAKMYGLSVSSINRIANGKHASQISIVDSVPQEESNKTAMPAVDAESMVVSLDSDLMAIPIIEEKYESITIDPGKDRYNELRKERMPVTEYVRMGMVSDRHNMPTDKYVFEAISSELMFDYDAQYEIAKKSITDHIRLDENGYATEGLFIYVTGLTCALTTIIKVCQDIRCNLTLLHYNNDTKCYERQEVFKDFISNSNIIPECIEGINFRNLYTLGCTAEEFVKNGGGYEISECFFEDIDNDQIILNDLGVIETGKKTYRDLVLFTDKTKAWEYYITLVENNTERNNIYFSRITINNGRYFKIATISKSINNI